MSINVLETGMNDTRLFYDSAQPQLIPTGAYAAVYINGYKWPQSEIDRMSKIFSVSVLPDASYADVARCIDVESGAASIADVLPFVKRRREKYDDATVYVNRSNWPLVIGALKGEPPPLYWVATLDGTLDVDGAWAVQYKGGATAPYDLSILRGVDNFHKP